MTVRPISVVFNIPAGPGSKLRRIKMEPDGRVLLLDDANNVLDVPGVTRTVQHERASGKAPKVRSRIMMNSVNLTAGGYEALTDFHDVHILDTSYDYAPIRQSQAVAAVLRVRFVRDGRSIRMIHDDKLTFYEMRNYRGNPERLALALLAADLSESPGDLVLKRALVTDSELGLHESINKRESPVFAERLLPGPFTMIYAGSDAGSEALNQLIKFCDVESRAILREIRRGDAGPVKDRFDVIDAPGTWYSRGTKNGVEADSDLVMPAVAIGPGTTVALYGKMKTPPASG